MKKNLLKIISCLSICLILSFIIGFFITSIVNNQTNYYQCNFTYQGEKDLTKIVNVDYLSQIKETDEKKYGSININKLVKKNDFKITKQDNQNYVLVTKAKYYDNFFYISKNQVATRAKTFVKLSLTNYINQDEQIIFCDKDNIVTLKKFFSPYLGGSFSMIFGLFVGITLICYFKNKNYPEIEDNIELFHTPFHRAYWKKPLEVFKDTKKLVTLAMLFSILLVSKLFSLPSGFGNLGIGLAYIFLAIIGLVYGPYVSIIIGALSDIIGYFINPQQGMFYFGYTIQAILASLTYALCFYKTRISFGKVFLSRLIVNLLLNVILGSYLQCRIFVMAGSLKNPAFWETFKNYALLFSLPKNLVYLFPQSLVLFLVFKGIIPVLTRFKLIDERIKDSIRLI